MYPGRASMPGATRPSARARHDEDLMRRSSELRGQRPHLWRASGLARRAGRGVPCGLHKIERLMRQTALRARPRRRALPKDDGERSAVSRQRPRSRIRGQRPEPEVGRRLHLHLDRRRLALRCRRHRPVLPPRRRLVDEGRDDGAARHRRAYDGDLEARQAGCLLHHSDQGSQYTSEQFQRLMADNGVDCSMSRSGNVWDNAAMESFFSSLKTERTAEGLPDEGGRQGRRVRLHREVLQPHPQALDHRLYQPG